MGLGPYFSGGLRLLESDSGRDIRAACLHFNVTRARKLGLHPALLWQSLAHLRDTVMDDTGLSIEGFVHGPLDSLPLGEEHGLHPASFVQSCV